MVTVSCSEGLEVSSSNTSGLRMDIEVTIIQQADCTSLNPEQVSTVFLLLKLPPNVSTLEEHVVRTGFYLFFNVVMRIIRDA